MLRRTPVHAMISADEVSSATGAAMTALLAPYGFQMRTEPVPFHAREGCMQLAAERITPWGTQIIIQTALAFDDGWSIDLRYGVSVDWVQRICDQLPEPVGYDMRGATVWGHSTSGPAFGQGFVADNRTLATWIPNVRSYALPGAFTFFNEWNSVETIERRVNDGSIQVIGMETETRYIKGTLLARLALRPDFETLVINNRALAVDSWARVSEAYDAAVQLARTKPLSRVAGSAMPLPTLVGHSANASSVELLQTLTVAGFDSSGEPEIRVLSDGSVEIHFSFMPPLNGATVTSSDSVFAHFETVLSAALQCEVLRDDRELFVIPSAPAGTAELAQLFLASFRGRES
jgi:hypothetical protein